MSSRIIPRPAGERLTVPAVIADAGDGTVRRSLEFSTTDIRSPNFLVSVNIAADITIKEPSG